MQVVGLKTKERASELANLSLYIKRKKLMESIQIEMNKPLTNRLLQILVNANPCLAESETFLLSYYKRVRATWSNSAISNLQRATGLKLTSKLNRCRFAIAAAKFELQFMHPQKEESNYYLAAEELSVTPDLTIEELPKINPYQSELSEISEVKKIDATYLLEIAHKQIQELKALLKEEQERVEKQQEQLDNRAKQLEQSQNFSALLIANRLLAPGLPLNGTEDSPAMRILGSPKTLTELEANYRSLIKREHQDVSPFGEEEAIHRFAYVRSLYRITREHWQDLKPTAIITKQILEKRMRASCPFAPESFWAA